MPYMSVTADTSHVDRSWLNDNTRQNIRLMSVTANTSHADRSWLKQNNAKYTVKQMKQSCYIRSHATDLPTT